MTEVQSTQVDTLNQILTDVVANRKNLASQIDTQKQQVEVGVAQLAKFDTLIATLQVTLGASENLSAVAQQEAANATLSPTDAASAVDSSAANAAA